MDLDPAAAISSALDDAPMVVLTGALLVGPTLIYILLRTAFSREKPGNRSVGRMLWACPQCSSVNESVHDRCYTCHFEPGEDDQVTIIDPTTGRPLTPIAKPWTVRTAQAGASTPAPRPSVAVGPGRSTANASTAERPIAASAPRPAPASRVSRPGAAAAGDDSAVLQRVGARRPFDTPSSR